MEMTTREFLKVSGGAALSGAALGTFGAEPRRKVRIAAIGADRRARSVLSAFLNLRRAEVVCAADVYAPAFGWLKKAQPKVKCFADYRKMLRECEGQYDAITIAVPDHIHCVSFLEALKYKKPVYCEKPLGHTLVETLAMMRKAKEAGIITHVGMQGNSAPGTLVLREWMESGALGQVEEAHLYCNALHSFYCEDPAWINTPLPVPKGLDWELWQGPIGTRRPFFRNVAPGGHWRCWTPYGEGCLTDWVCHVLGPLVTALDLDLPTAVTLDAPGFDPAKTPFAFPLNPRYTFEFPAKGARKAFKAYWYDVNRSAPRPAALEADQPFEPFKEGWAGAWVKCEKETVMYGSHGASGVRIVPHARMKTFQRPPQKYPRVKNHFAEFLDAIQQNRQTNTPFELGGKISLMGLIGTVATRFPGQRLTFDAQAMRFTNCEAANALLRPDWSKEALATYGAALEI